MVSYYAHAAFVLWTLGYPDQALARLHQALSLAQALSHAYSLARALYYAAWLHQSRREAASPAAGSGRARGEQRLGQWEGGNLTFLRAGPRRAGTGAAGVAQMQQGV